MSTQHNDFPIQALRLCALAGLFVGGCGPGNSAASREPLPAAAAQAPAADAGSQGASTPAPAKEPAPLLTDEELADGWISLFDGHSLFGWKATSQADWAVRDGAITVGHGEPGLLCTTTEFADYVLQVDFRGERGTNSGIFLHTTLSPRDPGQDCYELNVAGPENPYPTGSLVQRQAVREHLARPEWQTCEVRVDGARLTVRLDGRQLYEYQDPRPLRRGHIGLQFNVGKVAFRNVKLKPLGLTSLLSGKSLTGWKQYPQLAAKFSIREDGSLHVQGGRGQLETEARYGDFALQFECLTQANVNSGVFFRCIPGQEMMGYEAQIHNGFEEGDRTRPSDCGTGGIFRRQVARRVVADDGKWFRETLLAHGLHVAVWVNGYQVTDWVDARPPDENPRKGLRLEPGTIMLQGHDASTDLVFRNLRAAELAKRQE